MRKKLNLLSNIYLKKDRPVSLILFLTSRCNARCSFCFIDFEDEYTQNKTNELSVDDYLSIAVNLKKSLTHLNITGGEPFLRNDLDNIISNFALHCSLNSIVFSTNGSYPRRIKDFIYNVCKKYPDIKFIFQFSVDSFPSEHNKIRKIPGLFDKTIESYNIVKNSFDNCIATCNLTISEDNYHNIEEIYHFLTKQYKIETVNPIIVRDEGVYKVPKETKVLILKAYTKVTNLILKEVKNKSLRGFSKFSIMGDILNAKNEISYAMTIDSYLQPKFFTHCVAGSIFGVIKSNGDVFPCEILDKCLGNIKEYDLDFMKLWNNEKSIKTRKWIKDTKCNCHWECIYTYNLISNPKYASKIATKVIYNKLS